MEYTCSCCGEVHHDLPDLVCEQPQYTLGITGRERRKRVKLSSDLCALDGKHFFVRCVLRIPIIGEDSDFGWGVWVSASRINFKTYAKTLRYNNVFAKLFLRNKEVDIEPWMGWLANSLPHYENTCKVKALVLPQSDDTRPLVELEPSDHPLAVHQRDGMPKELAINLAEKVLHGHK